MARHLFGGGPADYVIQTNYPADDPLVRIQPGVVVTVWDQDVAGNRYTDLQLEHGGELVENLTTTEAGRLPRFFGPEGVTTVWIDTGNTDRYVLESTDLGDLLDDKLGKTETPAPHQHSGADVPSIQRQLDATMRCVQFNPATNLWPYQADITPTYPPTPVFWRGNAAIPIQARKGLDYIDQLEGTYNGGSTNIPDPPEEPDEEPVPDPDPDPDPEVPVKTIAMTMPVPSPNGATVALTASLTTSGGPQTFAYVQIAVRGPSGQNTDTAFKRNVVVDGKLDLADTFIATASGPWTAWVTYNKTGGAAQSDWVDGPKKTFTVTLPVNEEPDPDPGGGGGGGGGGVVPVVGRSGLQWNSGVFVGGMNANDANAFVTFRNRPIDAYETFVDRSNWDTMFTVDSSWAGFPGLVIISIPPQPGSQNNSATAAGSNNQRWRDYGTKLKNAGLNKKTTVIRLGWECNGDWYGWSWGSPNNRNTPASFVAAVKNVVTSLRATCPNVLISINMNKNNKRSGADWRRDVYIPLLPYYDIIGLDSYDMYGPSPSAAAFISNNVNQDPGLASIASFCRSNGKKMALEEWAPVVAGGADGTGGGDNPTYIHQFWNWFVANRDVLAYEIFYYHIGTSDYDHRINPPYKPAARAAYLSHWGR